jgi:cell division topological specificity factor
MTWLSLFSRRKSASVARERLQILLTHERVEASQSDLIPTLREEILAVVKKHVAVDPDKVEVKIDRGKAVSLLEIDIEIPATVGAKSLAPIAQAAKAAGASGRLKEMAAKPA